MSNIRYEGVLLTVTDLTRAQNFYENVLEQKTLYEYDGQMVTFMSGISLILEKFYKNEWISEEVLSNLTITHKSNASQLYFEVENLEVFHEKLKFENVNLLHNLLETGYGARTVRFYDFDGHLIECTETLPSVAKRLQMEGMLISDIADYLGDTVGAVEELLAIEN